MSHGSAIISLGTQVSNHLAYQPRHQLLISIWNWAYDFIHLDINTSISRFCTKRRSHCAFLDQVQVCRHRRPSDHRTNVRPLGDSDRLYAVIVFTEYLKKGFNQRFFNNDGGVSSPLGKEASRTRDHATSL